MDSKIKLRLNKSENCWAEPSVLNYEGGDKNMSIIEERRLTEMTTSSG